MMTQGGINGVSIIFLFGSIPEIYDFEMFQLKRKKEVFTKGTLIFWIPKNILGWGI